ncbi:MAG: DUF4864 domain-containing protein [Cucumibacter sp.]
MKTALAIRLGLLLPLVAALWLAAARAEDGAPDPAAWQEVISGQIEAFRQGHDAVALFYAGALFRRAYSDPAAFVESIRVSGYAAIIDSVAHSFGGFELISEDAVLQIVTFDGGDLHSYRALYQLDLEDQGWRVQGVMLREIPGVHI